MTSDLEQRMQDAREWVSEQREEYQLKAQNAANRGEDQAYRTAVIIYTALELTLGKILQPDA